MTTMKLPTSFSMNLVRSSNGPPRFCLRLKDEGSGCVVVETYIDPATVSLAMSGLAENGVEVEWSNLDKLGLSREHKEETVPYKRDYGLTDTEAQAAQDAALAPFEVDGWTGRRDDMSNGHRLTKGGVRVTFVRWVRK